MQIANRKFDKFVAKRDKTFDLEMFFFSSLFKFMLEECPQATRN